MKKKKRFAVSTVIGTDDMEEIKEFLGSIVSVPLADAIEKMTYEELESLFTFKFFKHEPGDLQYPDGGVTSVVMFIN